MTINNTTTKKNLNDFLTLTMKKGEKKGLKKSELDDLYTNAINVFFFNDLEKTSRITEQMVDYFWCVLNPRFYQNWKAEQKQAKFLSKKVKLIVDNY